VSCCNQQAKGFFCVINLRLLVILKPLLKMKVKKTFYGADGTEFSNDCIEAYARTDGNISVVIEDENGSSLHIILDVPTSIQFAKELRKSINLAKQ